MTKVIDDLTYLYIDEKDTKHKYTVTVLIAFGNRWKVFNDDIICVMCGGEKHLMAMH